MGELIAIFGALGTFALYQVAMNKESDRRMDGLRIDLNDLKGHLMSHVHISAANQDILEEKINMGKSLMNSTLIIIDEKINILTGLVNKDLEN